MRCTLISVAVFRAFSNAQVVQLVISALEFSDRSLYTLEESLAKWGVSPAPVPRTPNFVQSLTAK